MINSIPIKFAIDRITNEKPFEIAGLGIGFVPKDRAIFPNITTHDNLEIAVKDSVDGTRNWTLEKIYEYFPELERLKESKGRNLSGGEQQMLTIARTVMGNPELILLDEPCEGLASQIEWVEPNALEKSTRKTLVFEKVMKNNSR